MFRCEVHECRGGTVKPMIGHPERRGKHVEGNVTVLTTSMTPTPRLHRTGVVNSASKPCRIWGQSDCPLVRWTPTSTASPEA